MAYDFHSDEAKYFKIQRLGAEKSILPYLKKYANLKPDMRVLEIGSHFGGNLQPFIEMGCHCTGVEIVQSYAERSKELFADEIATGKVTIVHSDIYDVSVDDLGGPFNIVFLKDSIEHIPNQEKMISFVDRFISDTGFIFLAFPPFYMPFGGHQQGARSKLISLGAWLHLMPRKMYSYLILKMGESVEFHDFVMSCIDTGISIERFEKAVKNSNLTIVNREAYAVAPIYKYKFGLPTIKLPHFFASIPYIRNLYTTSIYYLLKRKR